MHKKVVAIIMSIPLFFMPLKINALPSKNMVNYNTSVKLKDALKDSKKDENKLKPLSEPKLDTSINKSSLSTKSHDWYFKPKTDGTPSGEPPEYAGLNRKYYGYILGDTSKKVIYITFDEGYEYGLTPKFLDILKANNVKASFFVTATWIKSNHELAKRMAKEGHCVCNHTTTHPSMAKVTDEAKFKWELDTCNDNFREATGEDLHKFFRPPMGKFSELSLYYTVKLGYRTVFWSCAYKDWETNRQKDPAFAKNILLKRAHNGAIYLLHAESKTNAEVLDYVIKELKSRGFYFETLDTLPEMPL